LFHLYVHNIYKTISTLYWSEEPKNYKRKEDLSTSQDKASILYPHESIDSSMAIEETSQTLKAT
jgi:hypothetical protein